MNRSNLFPLFVLAFLVVGLPGTAGLLWLRSQPAEEPAVLAQPATRTIQAVQATLSRPGGTTVAPGLLVQVAEEADRIALPVRRRP